MKKVFLFAAIMFVSVSFMGNYAGGSQSGGKAQPNCPYLNKHQSDSNRMICPYLEEHSSETLKGQCPYLNGNSGSSEIQCPYLRRQKKATTKEERLVETVDMVNT